jgi:hypothetical protein
VRTSERPERHFADSFATVRLALRKVVRAWVEAFVGPPVSRRKKASADALAPDSMASAHDFRQ